MKKTGTSYIQNALWASGSVLAEHGLQLVPATRNEAFWLTRDIRQRYEPATDPPAIRGALHRLQGTLDHACPRAVITSEMLSGYSVAEIDRLLSAVHDREVHVIVTVRDIARLIPSYWQQTLKRGWRQSLPEFVQKLRDDVHRKTRVWLDLDAAAVVERWLQFVPAERIHVVTVPQRGASPDLLLQRFCGVLAIEHTSLLEVGEDEVNRSLTRESAELLRRINWELPDQYRRRPLYGAVGKRYFARQILGGIEGQPIRLSSVEQAWCEGVAEESIGYLEASGVDVVGDLEDLRVRPEAFVSDLADVSDTAVAKVAVQALAQMLRARMDVRAKRMRARRLKAMSESADDHGPIPARRRVFARLRSLATRAVRSLRSH